MNSTLRNLTVLAVVAAAALPLALAQEVSPDDRDLLFSRTAPPNVLLILDSGQSMTRDPGTDAIVFPDNGDNPGSKLYQAKDVLSDFVLNFPDFNMGFSYYQKPALSVAYLNYLYQVRETGDTDGDPTTPEVTQGEMMDGTAPGRPVRMGDTYNARTNGYDLAPAYFTRFGREGADDAYTLPDPDQFSSATYPPCATDFGNTPCYMVKSYLLDAAGAHKVANSPPYYYPAYDWDEVRGTGVQAALSGAPNATWAGVAASYGIDITDLGWKQLVHDYALADIEYVGNPWGAADLAAWKSTATSNQIGAPRLRINEELAQCTASGQGNNRGTCATWVPTATTRITEVEWVNDFVLDDHPDGAPDNGNETLTSVDFTGSADCGNPGYFTTVWQCVGGSNDGDACLGYWDTDSCTGGTCQTTAEEGGDVPIVPIPSEDDPYNRDVIASYLGPQPTPIFYFPNRPSGSTFLPTLRTSFIPLTEVVIAAGHRPIKDTLNNIKQYFDRDLFDPEQHPDSLRECRKTFVILITDGAETCSNLNAPCSAAANLGRLGGNDPEYMKVSVFVIAFGRPDMPNQNVIACVAEESGGQYFLASSAAELGEYLNRIGIEIERRTRGFASPVVPSVQTSSDQVAYVASFLPSGDRSIWKGELYAYLIDPLTGTITVGDDGRPDTQYALWEAGTELEDREASTREVFYGGVSGPGLAIPAERYEFEYTGDGGANDTRLRDLIRPTLTDAELETTIDFIRGVRDETVYAGSKLGDIFHSTPEIYGRPACYTCYLNDQYGEFGDGYRSVFRAEHAKRRQIVFLGANDGSLHAFDAAFWDTDDNRYDTGTGTELFAWVPREVMPTLDNITFGLNQRWSVDGPATVADVYIDPSIGAGGSPAAGEREWRTLALFGERQGGRSVVVLDVTTPDPYDADADGVPLPGANRMPGCLDGNATGCSGPWPRLRFEFKDTEDLDGNGADDLGYTWSKPLVGFIKLDADNDPSTTGDTVDRSVAIFGGGYDRYTPAGNWLYILDLETGEILLKENVIGKAAGQVAATDLNLDGYFERIYWGTTNGKIWRMDVDTPGLLDAGTPPMVNNWAPYVLFNAGDTADSDPDQGPLTTNQPFFLEPKLIPITFDASGYPVLAIALGSGNRDNLFFHTSEDNRFYLVVDSNDGATVTEANLQAVAVDAVATTSNYLNHPTLRGWYLILSDNYEKTNTAALIVDQYVIFSTFSPTDFVPDPNNPGLCIVRGHAKTYVVDLWNANPAGDGTTRFTEHGGLAVIASEPVLYTGADGEVHILQSLDDLQLTEPIEPWAIPLRVFSWKED